MKKRHSIQTKVVMLFVCTSLVALFVNAAMFLQMNQVIHQLDSVYESNLLLDEMTDNLRDVHTYMYQYLDTKSSDSLEHYYQSEQEFRDSVYNLKNQVSDSKTDTLEYNIRHMSNNYLTITAEAVQAKRGRNIAKYSSSYDEARVLYRYLTTYITKLNHLQFQSNSNNYSLLRESVRYLEVAGIVILLVVIISDIVMVLLLMRRITLPLEELALAANRVAGGDLDTDFAIYDSQDEVEVLARAFDQMLVSIRRHIEEQRISMEKENELREKDLKNQALLKDAQLKYLQSQINPHFLFNTLNAGMQLATLEDAERTAVYIENMAEFFRYNLSKNGQQTTLGDEIELVDHYLYILNVRFAGEIQYEKKVDESLFSIRMPSMVLQPLVENAYQYGIRDAQTPGKIQLITEKKDDLVEIHITDNGQGMEQERIEQVMAGVSVSRKESKKSNGVGMYNVRERLQIFYGREDVFRIESEGRNKGTDVVVIIPADGQGGERDV